MKRFLLTAGSCYYPQSSDGDWVGIYETREEAEALISTQHENEYFSRGPRKGQIKSRRTVDYVNGKRVDWYEIIDLENWVKW